METWQHFVIEITYLIPAEQFGDVTAKHRAYLQKGYDEGWLLFSGPQVPRTGGIIIARAPGRDVLLEFIANDPYQVAQIATYRLIEFNPVLQQSFLADWTGK